MEKWDEACIPKHGTPDLEESPKARSQALPLAWWK